MSPFPRDQSELDRAYSPSSCIEDINVYLDAYAVKSAAARERFAGLARMGFSYGPHGRQWLDFFPSKKRGGPLLVFLHGGFWSELDARSFSFPASAYTAAGVNFAAINYRLAPEASLTEIVADVRTALAVLVAQSSELGFDAGCIVLAGHSAGAHLAAMMMVQPPKGLDTLAGALLISGVYDLEPVRRSYVNETISMSEPEARENSPAFQLPSLAAKTIISVGGNETKEFHRQSRLLQTAWKNSLLSCDYLERTECNHFDILYDLESTGSSLFSRSLQFFPGHDENG